MKVKICGITNLDDALAAVDCGADLLGFNFYPPSPRHIFPQDCASIVSGLHRYRSEITLVGVFVNAPVEQIRRIQIACDLDLAQLSGDEPPEALQRLDGRAFKGLRHEDQNALIQLIQQYPERPEPPAYLIDAYRPGQYGGTGHTISWGLAAWVSLHTPLLLAGGLTPDNVARAVHQVRPWGVDVASGVESGPGRKDVQKMRAFITTAKSAADVPIRNERSVDL
jgi:phosphoribosylanthranilate isomerase